MKKVFITLLLYLAFQFLGMLLAMALTAGYLIVTQGDLEGFEVLYLALGIFLPFVLIFLYLYYTKSLPAGKASWSPVSGMCLAVSAVLCLSGAMLLEYLMSFLSWLPDLMKNTFTQISGSWLGIISVAIVGPVIEELVFRGVITRHLIQRYSPTKAIVISALVFGLFHMNPPQIISAGLMGLVFAWVYYKTGSLIPGIVMHVLNNSLSVYLMIRYPDVDTAGELLPHYYVWLCLFALLFLVACYWMKKGKSFSWNSVFQKEVETPEI